MRAVAADVYSAGMSQGQMNQRYYSSIMGRFLTPDPYKAGKGSVNPMNPQSWNRYAYVQNDPVNSRDPKGLFRETSGGGDDTDDGDGGDPRR